MNSRKHRGITSARVTKAALIALCASVMYPLQPASAADGTATFSWSGPLTVAAGQKFTESVSVDIAGDTANAVEADLNYSPAAVFTGANGVGSNFTLGFFNSGGGGQTTYIAGAAGTGIGGKQLISNNTFRAPCSPQTLALSFRGTSVAVSGVTNTAIPATFPSRAVSVTAAAPGTVCATPSVAGQAASRRTVTLTGSGFSSGTKVNFGAGIATNSVSVSSASRLTATVTLAATAAIGDRGITITRANGTQISCSGCFTVTPRPTISGLDSNVVSRSSTLVTSIRGTNFTSGARVVVSGAGVTAQITNMTPTRLDVAITASSTALAGARSITVRNADGGSGSCTQCLTVS